MPIPVAALAFGALALAACSTDRASPTSTDVASVDVTPSSSTIAVGASTQLTATARNASGNPISGQLVTWSSAAPAIATVASTGIVTARAAGTAAISATSNGRTGTVTVTTVWALVATVGVSPSSSTLTVGQTAPLTATARDASGNVLTGRTVTWSSSNNSVATVSASGLVTAVASGSTTITATSEGQSGTSAIVVSTATLPGGEPFFDPSTDQLIVTDDFDGYDGIESGSAPFTARYPNYRTLGPLDDVVPTESVVSLVPGRSGKAIRLRYGGQYASDIVVGPERRLGSVRSWNGTLPQTAAPYTHFFFTTWFRLSSGADPAATSGSGIKGFMFWSTSGRYQNAVNQLSADGRTRGPKGANPCNAQSGLPLYKTADGCAPLFSTLADGNWHRFTIEIYAGSDPSGRRGERYWIDGALVYDDVDQPVGPGTRADHYDYASPIMHWMVFGNFANGPAGAGTSPFTTDIDGWTAWTR